MRWTEFFRTRVVRRECPREHGLRRAGLLTPYTAEIIAEDALRAGSGARLDLVLAAGRDEAISEVHDRFAWLEARGVRLTVRCEGSLGAALRDPSAAA